MKRHSAFTLIELLIVVAIIAILAAIAVPNFLEAQIRSQVSRVQGDMRSLAVAIESYRVDTNAYPAALCAWNTADSGFTDSNNNTLTPAYNVNYALASSQSSTAGLRARPTFSAVPGLAGITTPTAYITSIPSDPFADTKGATFEYVNMANKVWFLASYGPDLDEGPDYGGKSGNGYYGGGQMCQGRTGTSGFPTTLLVRFYLSGVSGSNWSWAGVNKDVLGPNFPKVTDKLLVGGYTYDATNGTKSAGDIWRLKQ
jgi:prepilin-type N-terminal cleavage/methylation domain-containing protein